MKRRLTEREIKTIRAYNLPPRVEEVVWEVWSEDEKPDEANLIITAILYFIGALIFFGSSAALWLNYFMPEIAHMQGLLNMVRFFFWIVLPLTVLSDMARLAMINKDKKNAFKKCILSAWGQKRGHVQKIGRINQIILVCGLVINGYFISGMMVLICFLGIAGLRIIVKTDIQKIIDKTASPQRDEIINAEFTTIH